MPDGKDGSVVGDTEAETCAFSVKKKGWDPSLPERGSTRPHAIGGVLSPHGLEASSAAATRKMSASRNVFATTCNPTG